MFNQQFAGTGMSLESNAKNNPLLKSQPTINDRNRAVRDSASKFITGMGSNAAKALNTANPVTFVKNVWDEAGQLPAYAKAYDKSYGDRIRNDLAQTKAKAQVGLGTSPLPAQSSSYANRPVPPPLVDQMGNKPMSKVDVVKNNYATGGSFNPEQLAQQANEQQRGLGTNSPYKHAAVTASNWKNPDKHYVDMDKSQLLTEDGQRAYSDNGQKLGTPYFDNSYMKKRYMGSHRPRTEAQRLAEGEEVQRMRERFILNSAGGMYDAYPGNRRGVKSVTSNNNGFDDELALRKHGLEIEKYNAGLGNGKKTPRFSDIIDENYNVTGSRFDGYFDERSGDFHKPQPQHTQIHPDQMKSVRNAYLRAKKIDKLDEFWTVLGQFNLSPDHISFED